MMKVFKLNKENKIEFTKDELKKLLDEVYNEGYKDCKNSTYTWTSPWSPWYYITSDSTTTNAHGITIDCNKSIGNEINTITYTTNTDLNNE